MAKRMRFETQIESDSRTVSRGHRQILKGAALNQIECYNLKFRADVHINCRQLVVNRSKGFWCQQIFQESSSKNKPQMKDENKKIDLIGVNRSYFSQFAMATKHRFSLATFFVFLSLLILLLLFQSDVKVDD